MRRRTLLVALAGLAVVVAAGSAVVLWPQPPSRITRGNFDQIRGGMTRVEVHALLGPPGDYATGDTEIDWDSHDKGKRFLLSNNPETWRLMPDVWGGDRARVMVVYYTNGTVVGAKYSPVRRVDQGPLDRLLWRAKRQWRRWFPE